MKRIRYTAGLAGLISLLVLSHARAGGKLVPGKDRIDVPVTGAATTMEAPGGTVWLVTAWLRR